MDQIHAPHSSPRVFPLSSVKQQIIQITSLNKLYIQTRDVPSSMTVGMKQVITWTFWKVQAVLI